MGFDEKEYGSRMLQLILNLKYKKLANEKLFQMYFYEEVSRCIR